MGIMVYSLLWVMQDFDHQPYLYLFAGPVFCFSLCFVGLGQAQGLQVLSVAVHC